LFDSVQQSGTRPKELAEIFENPGKSALKRIAIQFDQQVCVLDAVAATQSCESARQTKRNRRRFSIYKRVYPSTLSGRIFPNVIADFHDFTQQTHKAAKRNPPVPALAAIEEKRRCGNVDFPEFPRPRLSWSTRNWPSAKYEVVPLLGANFAVAEFVESGTRHAPPGAHLVTGEPPEKVS
jgi:hypothetical protein